MKIEELSVWVESREPPKTKEAVLKNCPKAKIEYHEIGDIGYKNVRIELKSWSDFVNALTSKKNDRFRLQMQRFKDNPRIKGYYIIHGEWKSIHEYSRITIESILSAIASIQARYNVKAIVVPSRKYAIYMALKIIEKSQDFKNVRPVAYKVDSGDRAVDMLVAAAEGVGINDAINLLNRFGSVKGVINASRDELLEVKKMGKKKVERLKRTINYDRGDDF